MDSSLILFQIQGMQFKGYQTLIMIPDQPLSRAALSPIGRLVRQVAFGLAEETDQELNKP
jgi:hypothetical protein